MIHRSPLKLVAPEPRPAAPPPPTDDYVMLPAATRARVERIGQGAMSIKPLAGNFTTGAAKERAVLSLNTIIAEATALRAELQQ